MGVGDMDEFHSVKNLVGEGEGGENEGVPFNFF